MESRASNPTHKKNKKGRKWKMKNILALILALVMRLSVVALAACSDGADGADGVDGTNGTDGTNGETGATGETGTSVVDAYIDVDGNLILVLSDGTEINAGCVVESVYGEAYGIVHTSYVGFATVTYQAGKLVAATLDEMCLPSYIKASEASDDTVAWATTSHGSAVTYNMYKTVIIDGVEYTFDTTVGDYVNGEGEALLADVLADADNCEAYYNAVIDGRVFVEIDGKWDTTVYTAATLQKTLNGYWTGESYPLGWAGNAEATIEYVKANGFEAEQFVKDSDSIQTDNNGVVTGATWNDMADYYFLLADAAEAGITEAENDIYIGQYSYDSYGSTYGIKVVVVLDAEEKISNIVVVSDEVTGWVSLSAAYPDYGWTEESRQVWLDAEADLIESFIGMTADEVEALSATIGGIVGSEDAVTDGYNVTGATQSSARLVLALQNALCGGASGVVAEAGDPVDTDGTYEGTKTGSFSEFEVTVVVTDGVVASVTVAETSKTNTTWTDKVTEAALTSLYNSVVGMTPAEVLEATTTDGFISGATDTSRTFLAAVADALTVKAD